MRTLKTLLIMTAIAATVAFSGGSSPVSAQETMMRQAGNSIVRGTRKTVRTTRRVGTTVGNRTWNGTRWVAANSWRGGKWVAVKTANGTRWVYRKGKRGVRGTRRAL